MSFNFNLQSLQESLQQTTKNITSSLKNLPSADQVSSSFQQNLNSLGKEVSNLQPMIRRTKRSLQEKFGSTNDISELPQEYKDLEKQTNDLKTFYKKILEITHEYEIVSYDYPPNLKESINDYTKIFNKKISGLSQATTTKEAEAILLAPTKEKYPKTFAHQFSRVLSTVREAILPNPAEPSDSAEPNPLNNLSKATDLLAKSEYKIGNERLEQDKLIISEFNNKIRRILKVDFANTQKLINRVETARLNFDTIRAEIKDLRKGDDTAEIPEKESKKLEAAEDELVDATEKAVESMKELVKTQEPVKLLSVLCKIQLNYHKNVTEELTGLVDGLNILTISQNDDDTETETTKSTGAEN